MRDLSSLDPLPMKLGAKVPQEQTDAEFVERMKEARLRNFEESPMYDLMLLLKEVRIDAGAFDKRKEEEAKPAPQLAPAVWPFPMQTVATELKPVLSIRDNELMTFGPTTIEYEGPTNGALRPGEWIEWKGGECPVSVGDKYEVKTRAGGLFVCLCSPYAPPTRWSHLDRATDIVAFRVIA